jgi:nicotinamide riboside kinase
MIELLPTSVLNECNVAAVIGPRRSGKTTLIRELASQQDPDVGLLITNSVKNGWEGFVPQGSSFKSMIPLSDIERMPPTHRKCFVLDGHITDMKNLILTQTQTLHTQVFNARHCNRYYWFECQSQLPLPSSLMTEMDIIFIRQSTEKQLKWLYQNHLIGLSLPFEVFKEEVAKIDTIPYAYTALVKKGSTIQIYWFVAGTGIDIVHKVGSDTFWNEMKKLETNEYVQYLNTGSE